MKRKHFILILIGIILMMTLTLSLQFAFGEKANSFGISCGMFFISIFCLFAYKNALTPMEKISFTINRAKRYYQAREELPKYQKICKILFFVAIGAGASALLSGFGEIIFYYLELTLAK